LYRLTGICFAVIVLYPFLMGNFGWNQNYSNIGIFVLLYLVAECPRKKTSVLHNIRIGAGLFMLSFGLLFLSAVSIHYASKFYPALSGKEMFFFKYGSPAVIGEAIGLFIMFYNMRVGRSKSSQAVSSAVSFLARGSLVSYLLHMHPVIQNLYTSYDALSFMKAHTGLQFLVQCLGLSVLISPLGAIVHCLLMPGIHYLTELIWKIAVRLPFPKITG